MSKKSACVVIFAKRPNAGKVKTRLAKGQVHDQSLTLDDTALLYQAFLDDYGKNFHNLGLHTFFCLPDRPESKIDEPLTDYPISNILEAKRGGRAAGSIGEAMAFTIEERLAKGFSKVIILGSDLPHLPTEVIEEALEILDSVELTIGDDGGGCYLVGASAPAAVLESTDIVWSEGKDFVQIQECQKRLGKSIQVLSQTLFDIDSPDRLERLIDELKLDSELQTRIPNTLDCLGKLGLI